MDSVICDTGKTLFFTGDKPPKPWLFTLIWQTMCVFINLGYVCFIILFYGLNTGLTLIRPLLKSAIPQSHEAVSSRSENFSSSFFFSSFSCCLSFCVGGGLETKHCAVYPQHSGASISFRSEHGNDKQ